MTEKFKVKELAQKQGLTQEALWMRTKEMGANVSLGTIQRIWQNDRASDPRLSTMLALARALGVSVEDLYNDVGSSYTTEHTISPSLAAA